MEPRKIVVTGNNTHCAIIQKYLNLPYLGGRGGSSIIDNTADDISPIIQSVIISLVKYGRLKDSTVWLNSDPPSNTGSHPKAKIIMALVAHE